MSRPVQPSLVLTSPRSPPSTTTTPSSERTLRNSPSFSQLRPSTGDSTPSRSRSPSPTPGNERRFSTSSSSSGGGGISALAAAGLGLLSLPPSPNPDQQGFKFTGVNPEDELEELSTPPRGRNGAGSRKSSIGFIEPALERDASEKRTKSRTRKMSFGLGLEGRMRRLSFVGSEGGGSSGEGSGGQGNASNVEDTMHGSDTDSHQQPAQKAKKSRNLIRRARSFGTSPLLGSSTNSASFSSDPPISLAPPPPPACSSPPYSTSTSNLIDAAHPSLNRLTTSSTSLASSSLSANSPTSSTPVTPLSAPVPYCPTTSPSRLPQPSSSKGSEEQGNFEDPVQNQSRLLVSPLIPTAQTHPDQSNVGDKGNRRELDAKTGLGFEEIATESKKSGGKDKEKKKSTSALRRATLSVFGRRETTSSTATLRSEEEPRRNSVDPPIPFASPFMTESPSHSPVQSRKNSSSAGLPSLPSLPSLQLSSNPYRMSWAFGSGSPTSSPAPSPSRQRSSGTPSRTDSPIPINIPTSSRPSLTISPVPSPRPSSAHSSPISANPSPISSVSPSRRQTFDQLPVPPLLTHTLSTDSSKTLIVSLPPGQVDTNSTTSSVHRINRPYSTSSPPLLRRTASYAPTTSPSPSSPLASPPLPLPSTSEPSPLDRRRTLTRAARSHSDASDRRSPSITTPPLASSGTSFTYGGGRGSVTGGFGAPPGGGYFASAHYRAGANSTPRRPGTAESPSSSGRTSVFGFSGGWSSLFGGSTTSSNTPSSAYPTAASTGTSVSMSRSSSTATSTPSTPGAGGIETNEFGALFDGSSGGGGIAKPSRPGTGRKRGLSVGNGFFGSSSVSNVSAHKERDSGRARSGSGSSVASDGPLKVPGVLGRMRASTDPHKRLSIGSSNFGSSTTNVSNTSLGLPSSVGGGASGSRPATSEGVASLFGGGGNGNRKRGSSLSFVSSSQQATLSPTSGQGFRQEPKPAKKYPTPRTDIGETPEEFVRRLITGDGLEGEGKVSKGDVIRVLSASSDPFYQQALGTYLRSFPFESLPLDIALRLFLCSSSLPPETQQIDRVMEAFARRWCECNPDLFIRRSLESLKPPATASSFSSEEERNKEQHKKTEVSDIPYFLAFSMVMLNTDAFNPNAKSKMTKADYVKNTRIDGVAIELLEYLYDQITLAPFVFVDEDNPASDLFDPSPTLSSSSSRLDSSTSNAAGTSSGFFGSSSQKPKIDPYHLIATGQTSRFRVDVESHIPFKSPFSYTGTTSFFNATTLHSLFARAPILQTSNRPRASSRSQVPGTNGTLQPPTQPLAGSPLTPTVSSSTFIAASAKDKSTISNLKITKVGVLSRKEDLAEGGKKAASRKWKAWSVVLTGSQLLFFKDAHFASSLQQSLDLAAASSQPRPDDTHVLVFTLQTPFKPDAVLSLNDTVALYDSTYRRHPNVFRLVAPAGRQYLFQAQDHEDLNSWLHAINYAASFKTAAIRIRPLQPPTLRSSTNSPVPPSPALSTNSSSSFRPQSHTEGEATGVLAASSGSPMTDPSRSESVTLGLRKGATSTTRATEEPRLRNGEASLEIPTNSSHEALAGSSIEHQDVKRVVTSKPLPELPNAMQIVNSRADILRTRINQLDESITRVKTSIQDDLCLAKHLSILTPFRSSTRERVLTAIPPIERRIRQTRMNLVKLICYREVLSRDLLVEERETQRFVRQKSLRRTTSQSQNTRSPPQTQPQPKPQQQDSSPHWASPLSQSHSSLVVPSGGDGSMSETGRESFESAAESLRDDTRYAFTDDELDRLQVRSPPLMQRSRTEQDWNTAVEQLRATPEPSSALLDDEIELTLQTDATSSSTPYRRLDAGGFRNGMSPTNPV
ncbi:hypothetical protein JCM3765_000819 [Sporobolomyces pararoseus]